MSSTYLSTTVIDQAVEAVAGLINGLSLFSSIYRGALGTGNGLCCEVGPTRPEAVTRTRRKIPQKYPQGTPPASCTWTAGLTRPDATASSRRARR